MLRCLRRAQAKLPELVGEAMAETVGDTASAQELLGTLRESFPELQSPSPADHRGPQPRRPRRDEDDDDWSNRSFLQ